jgi:hypothetical protein
MRTSAPDAPAATAEMWILARTRHPTFAVMQLRVAAAIEQSHVSHAED